jgi:hypothetical protein
MKIMRTVGMWIVCGMTLLSQVLAEGKAPPPSAQAIADKPERVVPALHNQNATESAAIVVQALTVIISSDWSEAKKRANTITLITYAVATQGLEAAPMMRIVLIHIPAAWLPLVAATAVLAAGDNSPAVAKAMLESLAGNEPATEACRAACANPSTVLLPTEIGAVRGIILPTPSQAPAKAPPLPTIIQGADKYLGQ